MASPIPRLAAGYDQGAIGERLAGLAGHLPPRKVLHPNKSVLAFSFWASPIFTVYRLFALPSGHLRWPSPVHVSAVRYWHSHFLQVRYPLMSEPVQTPSGIPLQPVYGPGDRAGDPPCAGQVSVHPGQLRHRLPREAVDLPPVLGLRHRRGVQPPLPVPARTGRHRPVGRARPADPVRLRLRRPGGQRGGRPGRRRRRHARRRRDPVRRHPAGQDQHQLHHQRHRRDPAGLLRRRRREEGRAAARSSPAPSRTTSSRSTRPAARGSGRRSRRCA